MAHVRSRVLVAAGAVAVLATLATGRATAGPAAPVDRQAWTRTGAVSTFVAAQGRTYVGADLGVEQARAFVHIDLAALPAGATRLVLVESSGSTLSDQGSVLACPLTSRLVGDGELSGDAAPSADCAHPTRATRAIDGTWSVPLAALVASWRSGPAFGLALVPNLSVATTFHIELDPARTAVVGTELPPSTVLQPPVGETGSVGAVGAIGRLPALDSGSTAVAPVSSDVPPPTGAPASSVVPAPVTDSGAVAPVAASLPSASSPSTLLVLALVGLVALGPALRAGRRRTGSSPVPVQAKEHPQATRIVRGLSVAAVAGAAVVLPASLGEVTVYKVGLVLVLLVGAIGLHLLVNWAGELSLAHAAMVGFPAFAVAKVSADHGLSPIVVLPLGIALGALAGGVVGLPAIRARGLQVALVTLAAGVVIDRFFFTREWFVGPAAGAAVPVPSLGPFRFASARSLYPVLAVLVLLALGAAWMLYRSAIVRGMLWVKADPAAAAAFGVPVARYRALAYVLAGAFAGFSGGLTAMWVQRLTPQAFPPGRSFTYLTIVALAGRGYLGGVAAAAAILEGGRLFLASGDAFMTYAAPVGLILTLTSYRDGLNGMGTKLRALVSGITRLPRRDLTMTQTRLPIRPVTVLGVIAVALGLAAIALAWYHTGNTDQVWVQNQEMLSGGLGGLALVVVGVGLFVYDRGAAERADSVERLERLVAELRASAAESP